jgi:uncharacterized protein YwgA
MQVDAKGILYKLASEEFFDLKRDTTKDRLKLQKTIYLLQANGLQLGYGFSWYKYGPYSQDLVSDAYAALRAEKYKYERETSSWRFSESSLKRFEKFKRTCSDILDDAEQLELVASVDFVKQTWYPEAGDEELISGFKQRKKELYGRTRITEEMIRKALRICKKLRVN